MNLKSLVANAISRIFLGLSRKKFTNLRLLFDIYRQNKDLRRYLNDGLKNHRIKSHYLKPFCLRVFVAILNLFTFSMNAFNNPA
jgi:hypothetical protein